MILFWKVREKVRFWNQTHSYLVQESFKRKNLPPKTPQAVFTWGCVFKWNCVSAICVHEEASGIVSRKVLVYVKSDKWVSAHMATVSIFSVPVWVDEQEQWWTAKGRLCYFHFSTCMISTTSSIQHFGCKCFCTWGLSVCVHVLNYKKHSAIQWPGMETTADS